MRHILTLALASMALFTACDGSGTSENPGNPNDLPDPMAGLGPDAACDGANDSDGNFQQVAGATTFWVGSFDLLADNDVRGTETLVVYANDAWKAAQPDVARDCVIVWNAVGKYDTESDCTSCDYRLNLDTNMDPQATTCDIAYARAAYDETQSFSYNVAVTCGGSGPCDATFTYPDTGTMVADGYAAGDVLQYTAPRHCQFY